MAKHDVNFRHGGPLTGDSGERGDNPPGIESIKPYSDGERAVAANFDRPPENLRQRTEVLRGETEEQKYLQDSDMRWVLASGNSDGLHLLPAAWPMIDVWEQHPTDLLNRWYFSLRAGAAVVAQPLNTPRVDVQETKTWLFPLALPTGSITISMGRRDYAGANIREVVWQALAPADIVGLHGFPGICDLQLSGEDLHILTITVSNLGNAQLLHLNAAFSAYVGPGGLIDGGFVCGVDFPWSDPNTYVTIADIPVGEVDYIFSKTFDRELHYIQKGTFDAFFTASLDNLLEDGDTLAIMWDYMVDPSPPLTRGRREAIPANGAATEVLVGRLFKTSLHPEWIPLAIPLCKRIDKELLWLDGTVATEGMTQPIRFGENGYTVERIYSAPTTVPITMGKNWYDTTWPWPSSSPVSWTTTQEALDGIVSFLAGTQAPLTTPVDAELGARLIGVPTITTPNPKPSLGYYEVPALGGDLKEVIHQMLVLINSKGSLAQGSTFDTDEETISGRWRFNNHVRVGMNTAFLRINQDDNQYHLVYRSGGKSENNVDVDWDTYSVYERFQAGHPANRIEVWGGYLDIGGDHVTAPLSGTGSIFIYKADDQTSMSRWLNVAAAQVLDLTMSSDWDYHERVALDWIIGSDLRIARIVEGNSYSAGVTFHGMQYWFIDQDVHGGVNYIDKEARIQFSSQSISRVLEGLYAMNEELTVPATWGPNCIVVSPGRALVDGQPVIQNTRNTLLYDAAHPTDPDPGHFGLMTQTLGIGWPSADTLVGGVPCWYYVWLRKDGKVFLGTPFPHSTSPLTSQYMVGDPGVDLNLPILGEVHSALGYAQRDYVLIGPVALMCKLGANYYFEAPISVGGGEYRFALRDLPGTANLISYQVAQLAGPGDATIAESLLKNGGAGDFDRCPGLPRGVSWRPSLAYSFAAGAGGVPAGNAISMYLFDSDSTYLMGRYNSVALGIGEVHESPVYQSGQMSPVAMNNTLLGGVNCTGPDPINWGMTVRMLGFFWNREGGPLH